MKLAIGHKKQFGTYNPSTLFDENENSIATVYGISSNQILESLNERDAEGLRNARLIVEAVNNYDALKRIAEAAKEMADELREYKSEFAEFSDDTDRILAAYEQAKKLTA